MAGAQDRPRFLSVRKVSGRKIGARSTPPAVVPAVIPTVIIALAIARSGERVLVTRRAAGEHLEGFWEFPGGKVEAGESAAEAASRELREETGIEIPAGAFEPFTFQFHSYADRRLLLLCFVAPIEPSAADSAKGRRHARLATLRELSAGASESPGRGAALEESEDGLLMPPANAAILERLRR